MCTNLSDTSLTIDHEIKIQWRADAPSDVTDSNHPQTNPKTASSSNTSQTSSNNAHQDTPETNIKCSLPASILEDPHTARIIKQFSRNNKRRCNPTPNLPKNKLNAAKTPTIIEMGKIKKQTTPSQTRTAATDPNANGKMDELLKLIANLNATIENLTKQLEEERRKNNQITQSSYADTNKFAALDTEIGPEPFPALPDPGVSKRQKDVAITGQKRPCPSTDLNITIKKSEKDLHQTTKQTHGLSHITDAPRTAEKKPPPGTSTNNNQAHPSTNQPANKDQATPTAVKPDPRQPQTTSNAGSIALVPPSLVNARNIDNARTYKPPPITLHTSIVKTVIETLKHKINNFTVKRINNNKHILHTHTLDNHKIACESLKQHKIQFFTYTPKSNKNITVLLKNIEGNFDPNEILEALANKKTPGITFLSVKRFTTKRSVEEGKALPIFLVQLSADSIISNLSQIKTILHTCIKWEKIIKKDRIQCKRCQRIGHAASNCNLEYRCVKCDQQHNPGECNRSNASPAEKIETPPFCINCKSHGHPASYRGCPKLKEMREAIAAKKEAQKVVTEKKISIRSNYIKPGISFSSVAASIATNKPATHNHTAQNNITDTAPSQQAQNTLLEQIKTIIEAAVNTQTSHLLSLIRDNSNKINVITHALDLDP